MSSREPGDAVLLRETARRLGLRASALVAVAMLLLIALVTLAVVRSQTAAANRLLRVAAATADDVGDPPPGSWLVLSRPGRRVSSPGLPAAVGPVLRALDGHAGATLGLHSLRLHGRDYRVATQRRGQGTVQVVLDLTGQRAQRLQLIRAMGLASAGALVLAGLLGAWLGRRSVRPLAEALALQRDFIADASHELRTPLTLLSTRAQLLDQRLHAGALDEQTRQDSAGVVADVHRLTEVVEDLLLTADPGGLEPTDRVDLARLVVAGVGSARAHAEQRGVDVVVHVTADPGQGPVHVLGAAPALRRAVLSLVDNAIDHTPAGGRVSVTVERRHRDVVLRVSDTGPGIGADAAKDVLRRFHSGGQRAGRAHYGLGLALSSDIANRHGGTLQLLDSAVGATFALTLPAHD